MLEKTFEQLEELGYDVTDVRYNCSHLYYGAWDKVIKNKTPRQALEYVEKLLSKCNADGNYSEVRGLQRYPLLIDSLKDFIRKNKKTFQVTMELRVRVTVPVRADNLDEVYDRVRDENYELPSLDDGDIHAVKVINVMDEDWNILS